MPTIFVFLQCRQSRRRHHSLVRRKDRPGADGSLDGEQSPVRLCCARSVFYPINNHEELWGRLCSDKDTINQEYSSSRLRPMRLMRRIKHKWPISVILFGMSGSCPYRKRSAPNFNIVGLPLKKPTISLQPSAKSSKKWSSSLTRISLLHVLVKVLSSRRLHWSSMRMKLKSCKWSAWHSYELVL